MITTKNSTVTLRRKVVIKVVPNDELAINEIRALTTIHHPNVIKFIDFVETDEHFQLIFLRWPTDLEGCIRSGGFPREVGDQRHVLRQIILGVNAIHKARWVHTDLKPGNILVNPRTRKVIVCDLGNAIKWSPGVYKGIYCTPEYCAPEVLLQSDDPDVPEAVQRLTFKTDAYAYACIVYEIVTGHRLAHETKRSTSFTDSHPFWRMFSEMSRREPKARLSVNAALNKYF